jgi:hypothetical protein
MKPFLALILGTVIWAAAATPAGAQATYYYNYSLPYSYPLEHHFIGLHDREVLRDYMVDEHARRCAENETPGLEPCGLASQSIRYYAAGSFLPHWVAEEPVPMSVQSYMAPAPAGASYVYAGGDVYLIDVLSRRVLDVVPLPTD